MVQTANDVTLENLFIEQQYFNNVTQIMLVWPIIHVLLPMSTQHDMRIAEYISCALLEHKEMPGRT